MEDTSPASSVSTVRPKEDDSDNSPAALGQTPGWTPFQHHSHTPQDSSTNAGDRPAKPPRKRKRTNPDGEKKHICSWPGCGKAFSRVDHLSRHSLNHTPNQIYKCDRCSREFVRSDLLVRHVERHVKREESITTGIKPTRQLPANITIINARQQDSASNADSPASSSSAPLPPPPPPAPPVASTSTAASNLIDPALVPPNPAWQDHQLLQNTFNLSFDNPASSRLPFDLTAANLNAAANIQSGLVGNGAASTSTNNGQFNHSNPSASSTLQQQQQSQPSFANALNIPAYSDSLDTPAPLDPSSINLNNLNLSNNFFSHHATGGLGGGINSSMSGPMSGAMSTTSSSLPSLEGIDGPLGFLQASYGAPFVSASEYDWLFDASGNFDVSLGPSRPASPGQEDFDSFDFGIGSIGMDGAETTGNEALGGAGAGGAGIGGGYDQVARANGDSSGVQGNATGVTPGMGGFDLGATPTGGPALDGTGFTPSKWMEQDTPQPTQPTPQGQPLAQVQAPQPSANAALAAGTLNAGVKRSGSVASDSMADEDAQTSTNGDTSETSEGPALEKSVAMIIEESDEDMDPDRDPSLIVNDSTRLRILDYLGPEWSRLRDDPRMTPSALANYLDLFWTKAHDTQVPVIHRASFRTEKTPTPLLLAMMSLGCYYGEKSEHALAVKIHPYLRGKVFCSPDFRPRAELWLHQTALLLILFGKMCSNRMAHEMAHIFWSSVVTLARRSGLFSPRLVQVPTESKEDLNVLWAAWTEEEVSKRIAHIVFATDVEHAALFRHSPTLSTFQMQLYLPCDDDEWNAPTAIEWARVHARTKPPIPFVSALKASYAAGGTPPPMNAFSRLMILHGLLSIAQDLQWRDHVVGISQADGRAPNWREICSSAYNSWKARLDTTLQSTSSQTAQLLRSSVSLYAVAHITLSIDVHEMQIHQGASTALGLVISDSIYQATSNRIKIWSESKDGRTATWHAAHFLRSCLQSWFNNSSDSASCLHHRWAVYMATLTICCYGKAAGGPPGPRQPDHRVATMQYLDRMCTNSPNELVGVPDKNNTKCLAETIFDYVSADSRWEIAQEGARLLEKLYE
ncbi:hypothetical protein T439DRAFT_323409 [Meredithblackwellia eburnea MCA 4105]